MRIIALSVSFWVACVTAVLAEQRIALVIGNSSYAAVTPLENAVNDARLIGQSLEAVGFEVILLQDAAQDEMKQQIAQFGRRLRAGGPDTVGLFYYAGHGVQSFGSNYLVPVDARLTDAADLDLVALEAASVLRQMASARNRTNIVILDACRNNPFEAIADLNDPGLAEMKAPTGTFLAYATAPGDVAFDGLGVNSPFTRALSQAIVTEGAPIEAVFKRVRNDVLKETNGLQTPWDTSSLTENFVFRAGEELSPEELAEEQLWNSIKSTGDPVQIMLFLRSYPEGRFVSDARAALTTALAEELQSEPSASAPPATPEPSEPVASPAPAVDGDLEMQLMETARASGRIEDYKAYLEAFPGGLFAELVKIEIESIRAKSAQDPDAGNAIAAAEPPADAPVVSSPAQQLDPVFFDRPMTQGAPEIVGLTIMEAANGSPLFPPIDGLPDDLWKGQSCANCHQWTREALCTQANTYLRQAAAATRALEKQHPYGGSFKRNLRMWAQGDCQ